MYSTVHTVFHCSMQTKCWFGENPSMPVYCNLQQKIQGNSFQPAESQMCSEALLYTHESFAQCFLNDGCHWRHRGFHSKSTECYCLKSVIGWFDEIWDCGYPKNENDRINKIWKMLVKLTLKWQEHPWVNLVHPGVLAGGSLVVVPWTRRGALFSLWAPFMTDF